MLRRFWPSLLILIVSTASFTLPSLPSLRQGPEGLRQRSHQVPNVAAHHAQYSAVTRSRSRCSEIQPPEALTTPNPLLTPFEQGSKVKVSFVVGTDGRIHSPLILQSAGASGDRHVLQAVRTWRYRPATCNGVPTESEGKVEFSSQ